MRQIALDTETTGLEPNEGHRIIEIGGIEIINRHITGNTFHYYLQPDRAIDADAVKVHGITAEFLQDKPRFTDIVDEFINFIKKAELLIHNAEFDTKFINAELRRLNQDQSDLAHYCQITDTLTLARRHYPGQKNALDALCKRLNIDNSQRTLHGALLDAQLLAEVYLALTGGQTSFLANTHEQHTTQQKTTIRRIDPNRQPLPCIHPTTEELAAHQAYLDHLDKTGGGQCLWRRHSSSADD